MKIQSLVHHISCCYLFYNAWYFPFNFRSRIKYFPLYMDGIFAEITHTVHINFYFNILFILYFFLKVKRTKNTQKLCVQNK